MTVLDSVTRWLDDPDGGGYFARTRDSIRSHDQTCSSLAHVWLPRRGGYSSFSDSMTCDRCEITFFWEGLSEVFEDCPESRHWLCACCQAKAKTCSCEPQAVTEPEPRHPYDHLDQDDGHDTVDAGSVDDYEGDQP